MSIYTDSFHAPVTKKKRNKGRQAVRVLISFPSAFLTQVDILAEAESRTRSELIREALRQYMRQESAQ